jgi:hypothetical protein
MHPKFTSTLALAGLLAASAGWAQEVKVKKPPPPPEALEWMNEVTRLAPGAHSDLAPVKVSYGLSWNNVLNAGEFEVSLDRAAQEPETALLGVAEGRSNGLARVLWPYDVEAEALVDRRTLRPRLFEVAETERGMAHRYRLEFSPSRVVTHTSTREIKPKKGDGAPIISEKTYRYDFIHDVLSAVLYIRSQALPEGDVLKVVVSPFNRPYHTEFEVLGREERKIKGETFDAIRLGIEIRKINSDRTLQTYEKMKKATIWLSDDEFRLPLEVQADIFVGYISARMTSREWLADAPGKDRAAVVGAIGSKQKAAAE